MTTRREGGRAVGGEGGTSSRKIVFWACHRPCNSGVYGMGRPVGLSRDGIIASRDSSTMGFS